MAAPHRARTRHGVRQAGPLALAGLAANGANVLVTVVIARLLSVRGYGSLNELVSVFLVLSMPGSALLVAVVRRVTAWQAAGQADRIDVWADKVRRRGVAAAVVFVACGFAARHWIATQLSLPDTAGVTPVIAAGAAWALLCVERGLLQAHRAYGRLARSLLVEGAGRTVFTIGLVGAGLGVGGATGGMLTGIAVAAADTHLSVRLLRRRGVPAASDAPEAPVPAVAAAAEIPPPADGRVRPAADRLAGEAGVALAALALLAFLQSLDVIIVGRFAPDRVGGYAAVSVASKALVYVALVLAGYLLPEVAHRWRTGQRALHELAVALGVLAVPAAVLLVAAVGFPRLLLRVAFGAKLTGASGAFAPLAGAMVLLGVTALCTHYLLGAGRRATVVALGLASAASVWVLGSAHGAPVSTAYRDLAVQAALAAVSAGLVLSARPPTPVLAR
ncbi:MAG TPA: hypothetical protein VFP54_08300 [Acidimicrobiales bacterium]|nr:hypothetical protein [Acidimicrobiales bacterium]